MIEIRQLTGFKIETIHDAFSRAFSDYVIPFDMTEAQLRYMIERRGCNLELSFGAFDGDRLVGFTLNGTGMWNGKLTAYDTGTGIIKEYRKKGIASHMFRESLPVLREHKIEQYLLEVIRSNTSAYELYKKAGFKVTRMFDFYVSTEDRLSIRDFDLPAGLKIKEIKNPDWNLLETFREFTPSWQNSIDSINRKFEYFKIAGVFEGEVPAAYGIIEKHTGDIPQLAVAKNYRRRGLATILLKSLLKFSETRTVKIINSDLTYEPFRKFAASVNLEPGAGQYEMVLEL